MSQTTPRLDTPNDDPPPLTATDRDALLASLENSRAEIAAGAFDVLTPGFLRQEFEAILREDPGDDALDALLGIVPR